MCAGLRTLRRLLQLLLVVFRQNSSTVVRTRQNVDRLLPNLKQLHSTRTPERRPLPNEKANICHENSQIIRTGIQQSFILYYKTKGNTTSFNYNYNNFVNTMSTNNHYDPATDKVPIAVTMAFETSMVVSVPQVVAPPSEIPENILKSLVNQGFTHSLARSLNETKQAFALRIWVIDNSGSMTTRDGHQIIDNGKSDVFMVDCSRWEEIRECVEYHIQLANMIDAPTRFRFLNDPGTRVGPQKFSIKDDSYAAPHLKAHEALSLMRKVLPNGCTPLTEHIMEIYKEISEMVPVLRRTGQKVAIILATVSFVFIMLQGQLTDSSCPTIFTHTDWFLSS
jgi:hypothetical protein